MYVTHEHFLSETASYAKSEDLENLKLDMSGFAKNADISKAFNNFRTALEKTQALIGEKCVQKGDLAKQDLLLRKWSKDQFESRDSIKKMLKKQEDKLAGIEELAKDVSKRFTGMENDITAL
jgi:hypothetical protein